MIPTDRWYTPLTKVTSVSKALALALFVALPFIGFWFGTLCAENERADNATLNTTKPSKNTRGTTAAQQISTTTATTTAWQTFDGGEALGFSIKYPAGWIVDTTYDHAIAFKNTDDLSLPREDLAFFRVLRLVHANPPALPINQWFDAYFSGGSSSEITSREVLTIGGHDAVRITYTDIGTNVATYIFDGLDVLDISYDLDNPRVLTDYEAMLQSLTITD